MTDSPKSKVQAAVGNIGFWLLVPPFAAVLAGWGAHALYSPIDIWAIAALVYALFTLWIIGRNQKWYVRGPLALANLALISAAGYLQWRHLRPVAWPVWTDYLGAGIAAVIWFVVAYIVFNNMGQSEQEDHQSSHTAPAGSADSMTTTVEERVMALVKLAGHKGDLTVNLKQILEQVGLEAEAHDRKSRIEMVESLMQGIKMGIYKGRQVAVVHRVIRELHKIPDVADEDDGGDDDGDWDEGADEIRPLYGQFS